MQFQKLNSDQASSKRVEMSEEAGRMRGRISRRRLLKIGAAGAITASVFPNGVPLLGEQVSGPGNKGALPMRGRYINPQAPSFDIPEITGKYYSALVPDTLDLADMAARVVHAMTQPTDPQADYEVYWWIVFGTKPPHMVHQFSDQIQFGILANLPGMRLISGSREGAEMEKSFIAGALKNVGDDGLFYNVPWARPWTVTMDQSFSFADRPAAEKPFASLLQSAFYLHMLNVYGQLSSDKRWKKAARRCTDSLIRFAVDRGDYAYYHKWQYTAGESPSDGPVPTDAMRGWADFTLMLPLLQTFEDTGYEPAGKLARKLLNYYTQRWSGYDPTGKLLETWPGVAYAGFPLWWSLVPLEWGLRTGDRAFLETARKNYEQYRPYIEPVTGYFPEVIHLADLSAPHTAESCFLAYVIQNALLLSVAGPGDYWDDVDRWMRNQFFEAQLRQTDWVARMLKEKLPGTVPPHSTTERVEERNLGSFAGFMLMNDWYGGHVHPVAKGTGGAAAQHCCTYRAAVAIYDVWKHMVHHEAGKLRVHLLLNHASRWADIDSHIPYTGQVDIKLKATVHLSVRIPEWVRPQEMRAMVAGQSRDLLFSGRYAEVGEVKRGQVATLTFPISERDEKVRAHGQQYHVRLRGNTVVFMDPPGQYCPIYQRTHYREGVTRWRNVTRFVTDKSLKEKAALSI